MKMTVYRDPIEKNDIRFSTSHVSHFDERYVVGTIDLPIVEPEKPKKTVTKEATKVYDSGAIQSATYTVKFLVPSNAKNVRCLYDVDEDN